MKKVILCTVVSSFVFSSFLVGLSGPVPAGALTAEQTVNAVTATGVEAIILIQKGGTVEILPGAGITFNNPKTKGGGPKTTQPGHPEDRDIGDLPWELSQDIDTKKAKYKQNTIVTYGDQTCVKVNGTYWCW